MGEVCQLSLDVATGAALRRLVAWRQYKDGPAYDLTGYTVRSQIRTRPGAPGAPVATFSTPFLGAPVDGKFYLYLSPSQTLAIPPGAYWFDVLADPPSGETIEIVKAGRLLVRKAVTEA